MLLFLHNRQKLVLQIKLHSIAEIVVMYCPTYKTFCKTMDIRQPCQQSFQFFEQDEVQRQQWSNPIEFLLSCIAMSVGLGSMSPFLYCCHAPWNICPLEMSQSIYICRCLEVSFHRLRKWRGSLFNPIYVSVAEIF